jgi:hypothetical protein
MGQDRPIFAPACSRSQGPLSDQVADAPNPRGQCRNWVDLSRSPTPRQLAASWQIPKLLPAREPHCLRKIIANHTSLADFLAHPRPAARRVCPPRRRAIAAAPGSRALNGSEIRISAEMCRRSSDQKPLRSSLNHVLM